MKNIHLRTGLRLLAAGLVAAGTFTSRATIPEPDNLVFGTIRLDGKAITATATDVVVEARRTPEGPAIARYQMGSDPAANAGNFYSLRIALESLPPVLEPLASPSGASLVIVLLDSTGKREQKPFTLGPRGQVTRVDFGDVDTDGNGLSDEWERKYFGATGQDPNADPDHDSLTNLKELQAGTNPLAPDMRHPADSAPADYNISITEVTAYGLAWKNGTNWPVGPNPIPIDYVTRAGTLWKGGEHYKQDLGVSPTAPLWWVNAPVPGPLAGVSKRGGQVKLQAGGAHAASTDGVRESKAKRVVSEAFGGQDDLAVQVVVTPANWVGAYAVEEEVPSGWVASAISDDGQFSSATRKLRWGPFFDAEARSLTYRLTPQATPAAEATIEGAASLDGKSLVIETTREASGSVAFRFAVPVSSPEGFRVLLQGQAGQSYDVEVSSDLVHWTVLTTLTVGPDGGLQIEDASTGDSARFYRAKTR